jgi:hypothetical protein
VRRFARSSATSTTKSATTRTACTYMPARRACLRVRSRESSSVMDGRWAVLGSSRSDTARCCPRCARVKRPGREPAAGAGRRFGRIDRTSPVGLGRDCVPVSDPAHAARCCEGCADEQCHEPKGCPEEIR